MKKIIALCSTSFQILISLAMKLDRYADDDFSLAIADGISDYKTIAENARKLKLFSNILLIEEKKYAESVVYKLLRKTATLNRIFARLFTKHFYTEICFEYDEVFFYSLSKNQNLWNIFAFSQKQKVNLNWFEEGVLINASVMGIFFDNKPDTVFHFQYLQRHITKQFLVRPDKLCYSVPFAKEKIDFPSKHKNYIEFVNQIFNYSQADTISQKYIFFDQNLSEMKTQFDKISVLNKIKEIVGKENLLVKLHPRNNTTEYAENFVVNKKTGIPWEVYLLNQNDIDDKVLIGMNSSSLVHPYYYFGKKMKVISILKMMTESFQNELPNLYFISEHFDKYTDIYKCPKTIDELVSMIGEIQ